jgi:PAS domain S-box-containing protein
MKERKPQRIDNEFVYPDGQKAWFELRLQPIPQGVFIFSMDINDRKKYEEIIKNEKAKYEAILTSIGEGMIATDEKGKTIIINSSAEVLLGYTTNQMANKHLVNFLKMTDKNGKPIKRENRPIKIVLETGKPFINSKDYYYLRKNGTQMPVALTVTPFFLDEKLAGVIEVFRDITKELEVDKAKTEFVSIASHALRTPLGIAKWYLEAMNDEKLLDHAPPNAHKYLEEVYKSNERLLYLVRDLLSISRIDQGKIQDNPSEVDIAYRVQSITRGLELIAEKKHITIDLQIESEIPPMFIDEIRFHEVIQSLLSNAIKYNIPHGRITITLHKKNDALHISIKDTGIGIAQEDQKKLFTKFYRAENAIAMNTEGSGLGLYVAKSYIENWRGSIAVASTKGKGTTFSIKIPILHNAPNVKGGGVYA